MNKTVIGITIMLYNMTLIIGTTYLVVNYNWSMGTYLLALFLMKDFKDGYSEEKA